MSDSLFDQIVLRDNTNSVAWGRYGPGVLPLWVADMDFRAPQEIIDAIKSRADHGIFGYGDSYPELRKAVSERSLRLYNWKVEPDHIRCSAGILPMFYFLICSLAKADESVVLFTPAYPPFFKLINDSGRKLIECQLKETTEGASLKYEIDFDALASAVSPKTKLLVFCNPYNPVGKVFSKSDLERLAAFCLSRKILIISDEIHSELIFEGAHIPTASLSEEVAQSTITLGGPTKTFNLPGLKVGHVIIQNAELRRAIFTAANEAVADVGPLSAAGALAAYKHCDYWVKALIAYLRENRSFAENFIKEKFPKATLTTPAGTYLTWINMQAYRTDKIPFELALNKGKVACGRGDAFGAPYENYIRISLACPRSMLKDGLERLHSSF